MSKCIKKLLNISSEPMSTAEPRYTGACDTPNEKLRDSLLDLLRQSNGFYAFESALHVFSCDATGQSHYELNAWNAVPGWRNAYGDKANGMIFFAEDVFGVQFAFADGRVTTFDPETGTSEVIADTLEHWACEILDRYNELTGYSLAHEWQRLNRPIANNERLLPKQPFFLGGAYDVKNLYAVDALKGMHYRGDIYKQTKDLPEGTRIRIDIG